MPGIGTKQPCSPRNENLNLLVQIKFLNLFLYSSKPKPDILRPPLKSMGILLLFIVLFGGKSNLLCKNNHSTNFFGNPHSIFLGSDSLEGWTVNQVFMNGFKKKG
jgi:hypothetical protein